MKKGSGRETSIDDYDDLLNTERDLEVVVLRAHMLIERELYHLLATRLNVSADHLARLSFHTVAHLALSGEPNETWRVLTLRFNSIRNAMAHDIAYGSLSSDLDELVTMLATYRPDLSNSQVKRVDRLARSLTGSHCRFETFAFKPSSGISMR